MSIKRIALGVRYDGTNYHGWQNQKEVTTIQAHMERALSLVANHFVTLTCAGRTDAGVHATAQVVHFDTDAERSDYSWIFGANSNLPPDICVTWAKQVDSNFHARFKAKTRTYRYIIFNHNVRPGILQHAVAWYHRPLDENLMQEAGNYLLGEHDFSAFRGADCQSKTAIRRVDHIKINRYRRMVVIEVKANAFLLHMVRNIAGALVSVGSCEKRPEWIKEVLESRDRRLASKTIAAHGLYLVEVEYPKEFMLPSNPIGPFFLP